MNHHASRMAAILAIALCSMAGPAGADGGAFKAVPSSAAAAGLPPLPPLPPMSLPSPEAPRQVKVADKSPGVSWPSADPRGLPPEPIQAAAALQGGFGSVAQAVAPVAAPDGPVFTALSLDAEGGRALLGERWLRKGDKIPGRDRGAIVLICRGEAFLDTGEIARAGQPLPVDAPKPDKAAKGKPLKGAPSCA